MKIKIFFLLICVSFLSFSQTISTTWDWATQSKSHSTYNYCAGIVTDSLKNSYVIGRVDVDSLILGSYTLANMGHLDGYVSKLDANGNVVWAKSIAGSGFDYVTDIKIDEVNKYLYIGGFFSSTVLTVGTTTSLGPPIQSGNRLLLVKMDFNGNVIWIRTSSSNTSFLADTKISLINNDIYIAGAFNQTLSISGSSVVCGGAANLFFAKYNSSGTLISLTSESSSGYQRLLGIAITNLGERYLQGIFNGGNFATNTFTLTNNSAWPMYGLFLMKYNANGSLAWAKKIADSTEAKAYAFKVDKLGNSYLAGTFFSPQLVLNTSTLTTTNQDAFIAKYDPMGNLSWCKKEGGELVENYFDIELDSVNNPMALAAYQSTLFTVGNYTLTNSASMIFPSSYDNYNIFIATYDKSNGQILKVRNVGENNADEIPHCMALDIEDNIFLAGIYKGVTTRFPPHTLSSPGNMGSVIAGVFFFAKTKNTFIDVGLGDSSLKHNDIILFPNPTTGLITLSNKNQSISSIEIFDISGKLIYSQPTKSNKIQFDLTRQSSGLYLLKMNAENGYAYKRIIKE